MRQSFFLHREVKKVTLNIYQAVKNEQFGNFEIGIWQKQTKFD